MDILKVPLNKVCDPIADISCWEWSGSAFDEGTEASEWFSTYLGKPSRLVRFITCRFSMLSIRAYYFNSWFCSSHAYRFKFLIVSLLYYLKSDVK